MSNLMAGHDYDDDDRGYSEERTEEIASHAFREGARACREMMARFVGNAGDVTTAQSIRANWHPDWNADPGAPEMVRTLKEIDLVVSEA